MKPAIYLWTGNGWGKTTSAIGAAIRAAGHGYKTEIIQFMKGRKYRIGEYRELKKIKKINITQFGRTGWVNLRKPSKIDYVLAKEGFEYAKKADKKEPFLLILDEINLAVKIGLLNEKEVLNFLSKAKSKHIYLTGRYATKELIKKADFVNEIIMKKGPKKLIGKKGIDF